MSEVDRYLLNGLTYKIGHHGFAYWWNQTEEEWIKSDYDAGYVRRVGQKFTVSQPPSSTVVAQS